MKVTLKGSISGPFVVTSAIEGNRAFVACLETSTVTGIGPLTKLAASAMEAAFADGHHLPDLFVSELHRRIVQSNYEANTSMCTAFAAAKDHVDICSAGDIRIYLIKDGQALNSTRDHIYMHDKPSSESADLAPHEGGLVPTRWLGSPCARQPERLHWPVTTPYTVLVCSSQYHLNGIDHDAIIRRGVSIVPSPEGVWQELHFLE